MERAAAEQAGGGAAGRVAFLGLGIMGSPHGREPRAGGLRAVGLDPHRREGGALRRRARRARGGHPGRGRRGRRPRPSRWWWTRPEVEAGAARRRRRRPRAGRGRAVHRHVHDRAAPPRSRIGACGESGLALRRRARSPARCPGPRTARSRSWSGPRTRTSQRALPLLEAMGELIVHVGPLGHGALVKLINNTVTAINAAALAEALTMVRAAGLDLDALLEVVGRRLGRLDHARPQGAADARARLRAALQARAHAQGRAPLPRRRTRAGHPDRRWPSVARALYEKASEHGRGDDDFASVIEVVEEA